MRRAIAVVGSGVLVLIASCDPPPPPPSAPPPPVAVAPPAIKIVVVDLDSEDATDEQADALTAALRSRLSATARWQLESERPSMTALIPALSCPRPPDSACLLKVGDHLNVDRYIWGKVTRAHGQDGQVVAEIHYWARGAPERVTLETYSNNLTDQNDDALRTVAERLVAQLDARIQ